MAKMPGVYLGLLLGSSACFETSGPSEVIVAGGHAELRAAGDLADHDDDDGRDEDDDELRERLAMLRRRGARLTLDATPTVITAGAPFEVRATLVDRRGRRIRLSRVPVTLTFTAAVLGPVTATTRRGVARFAGLSTCRAGSLAVTGSATVVSATTTLQVAPGPVASSSSAGGEQVGVVGGPLPAPLTLTVSDGCGNPVPGASVSWAGDRGRPLAATTLTDATGTTSTNVVLATTPGRESFVATVTGLPPATFVATAVAGPPAIVRFGPLPASVIAGTAVEPPIEVTVTDAFGNRTGGGLEATLLVMRDGELEPDATHVAKVVEGRATFTSVMTQVPGAGFYLTASVAGVTVDGSFFVSRCGLTTVDCEGACRDLTADPGNCGGCGLVCDPGATCTSGGCSAPLAVMATTPAAGASGVVPSKLVSIEVELTDTLDPATVAGRVVVATPGGPPLAGTIETTGNRVRFHPATGQVVENQTLTGTVGAGVASLAGATLAQPFTWTFDMLPSHGVPYLSRRGLGSDAGARDYYAQLPFGTRCTWDWQGWLCAERGISSTFEQWLFDFAWIEDRPPPPGTTVSYYNRDDLALGRRATCYRNPAGTANPGTYCFVTNHGPVPGTAGHPDPAWALADTVSNRAATSISMMFRTLTDEVETATGVVPESTGVSARTVGGLNPGDVVTIGPATGTLWAGNIFFGDNGPDGAGVNCATTIFDPAPCPLEGAPLYGLLVNTPPAVTSTGAVISGRRFLGASTLTFKVTGQTSRSLYFTINDHLPGNGHGELAVPVTVRRANTVSFQVYVPGPTGYTPLVTTTTLDGEGNKLVPQACMACHGGHLDAETSTVTGASFLPFDVGRLTLPNVPGYRRADQEYELYTLNQLVLATRPNATNPNDPIGTWIRGTYGSTQVAADDYTPPAWGGDVRLYQQVVRPYCQVCHQALGPGLDFSSASQFRALTAAIRQAVCVSRTMPHAEATFVGFWQSGAQRVLAEELLGGSRCGP